ncbi:MAG: restriction endonuclease subunit S, partial [Chloroflexi bacterium]|nr:restriction endonuclease subunit S [Chloroflexota bacterium]
MKDLNTNGMNKPNNTKEEDLRPLPEGWVWTNVGQVTLPVEKVSPKQKPNIPFVYIDISSIDNSIQKIVEPKEYLGLEAPSRARQLVRVNDVVFSTVRTYLRNVALVPEIYNGQIASTGFTVLRASNSVKSKFLFYFTLTDEFLSPLNELQRGTSYPAVRDGDVRVQPFPLPPLTEQERIVARLEELLSELEAGVAALERVRAGAKRYKASVLKAACEGKLFGDKGIVNGELPEGWVWKNIRECGTVITGTTPSKKDPENYGNHLPFVKPPELKDCSIFTAEDNLSEKG